MAKLTCSETETLRAARARYWEVNGFGDDGGESKTWEIVKLGPLPIPIRNIDARKLAIKYHDLHHLITGYDTDIIGEAEISAWEIASGCNDKWVAWILDFQGLLLGLPWPRRLLQAWTRGRRSKNLYREEVNDTLLAMTVGDLRKKLALAPTTVEPTIRDVMTLSLWVGSSLLLHLGAIAAVVAGVWWGIGQLG